MKEKTLAEQIADLKITINRIETCLPYADGQAYYNDLERLRELHKELRMLEEKR